MSTPFDATSKSLVEQGPADWLAFLGLQRPPEVVTVIDADLATVSAMADKVIRVADEKPWVLHLEFQAAWDGDLPRRMLAYNANIQRRHNLDAYSVVVLLARAANASSLTGTHRTAPPLGRAWEFPYDVLRVWEVPPDRFVTGPLALVPLAPLGNVRGDGVPGVVEQVRNRLIQESSPRTNVLWASMIQLLQLRSEEMDMADIFPGLKLPPPSPIIEEFLRENPRYIERLILEKQLADAGNEGRLEGRLTEARAMVLRLGTKKFGPPPADLEAKFLAESDLVRLEQLLDRVFDAGSWDELLRP